MQSSGAFAQSPGETEHPFGVFGLAATGNCAARGSFANCTSPSYAAAYASESFAKRSLWSACTPLQRRASPGSAGSAHSRLSTLGREGTSFVRSGLSGGNSWETLEKANGAG